MYSNVLNTHYKSSYRNLNYEILAYQLDHRNRLTASTTTYMASILPRGKGISVQSNISCSDINLFAAPSCLLFSLTFFLATHIKGVNHIHDQYNVVQANLQVPLIVYCGVEYWRDVLCTNFVFSINKQQIKRASNNVSSKQVYTSLINNYFN